MTDYVGETESREIALKWVRYMNLYTFYDYNNIIIKQDVLNTDFFLSNAA